MRMERIFVLGASMVALALVTTSCGSTGGPSSSSPGPIASKMTLGGPPECPTRPFCEAGLTSKYGLHFKAFKALDACAAVAKNALDRVEFGSGLMFSSDWDFSGGAYGQLVDDRHVQYSDNVV